MLPCDEVIKGFFEKPSTTWKEKLSLTIKNMVKTVEDSLLKYGLKVRDDDNKPLKVSDFRNACVYIGTQKEVLLQLTSHTTVAKTTAARQDEIKRFGKLESFGEKIEENESVIDCAFRELLEEMGISDILKNRAVVFPVVIVAISEWIAILDASISNHFFNYTIINKTLILFINVVSFGRLDFGLPGRMSTLCPVSWEFLTVAVHVFSSKLKLTREKDQFLLTVMDGKEKWSIITVGEPKRPLCVLLTNLNALWLFPGCIQMIDPFNCFWPYEYILAPQLYHDYPFLNRLVSHAITRGTIFVETGTIV